MRWSRPRPQSWREQPWRAWPRWSWLPLIGGALLVALGLLLSTIGYGTQPIASPAMAPTLEPGAHALVEHTTITPDRGDVVSFDPTDVWPHEPELADLSEQGNPAFTFRVVGLPGDHVRCCSDAGEILVNGDPLPEPDGRSKGNEAAGAFDITVDDGRVFLLGDARDIALNSRARLDDDAGTVPVDALESRVIGTFWLPWKLSFLRLHDLGGARFLLGIGLLLIGGGTLARSLTVRLRGHTEPGRYERVGTAG